MEPALPAVLTAPHLRQIASWIRDDLDLLVAREGPMALDPNDVLTIHSVLLALRNFRVPLKTLRLSRIHIAVAEMRGKATRWPRKLVDEADNVVEAWEKRFGKLKKIRVPLFEDGGRLWGVCDASDVSKEALLARFEFCDPQSTDNSRAHRHGHLGFNPGDWWINGMFAFHQGIIDLQCTTGGICFNNSGAYAVVMRGNDEAGGESSKAFTYRCGPHDRGRFRLTSADSRSRHPVRILRTYGMVSSWAPRVGVRYDGLHKVAGWTCHPVDDATSEDGVRLQYDIHFEYVEDFPMTQVLRRPIAEEVDDFYEYQRVIREEREAEKAGGEALAVRRAKKGASDIICRLPGTPSSPEVALAPPSSSLKLSTPLRPPKLSIMNIKAEIEAANLLAGFGSFGSGSSNISETSGFSRRGTERPASPMASPRIAELGTVIAARTKTSPEKAQRVLGTGVMSLPTRRLVEGKSTSST